jgi:hypothetical protein
VRHALAAITVAHHDDGLAAQHDVGRTHDAVDDGDADAKAVLHDAFRHRVVDDDGREAEGRQLFPETVGTGRRLLRRAEQRFAQRLESVIRAQQVVQITAIVSNDVGPGLQHTTRVFHVVGERLAPPGEDVDTHLLDEVGGGIVLRRTRAAGDRNFRASCHQGFDPDTRFCFHVQADADLAAAEGLFDGKAFPDRAQDRHIVARPVDPVLSRWGEADVLNQVFAH